MRQGRGNPPQFPMKKITSSFLIVLVLWASVIAPARALVWFPLLTGASGIEGALVGAAGLAAAVAAMEFSTNGDSPSASRDNVGLQIQLDPYTPLIVPDSAKPAPVIDSQQHSGESSYRRNASASTDYSGVSKSATPEIAAAKHMAEYPIHEGTSYYTATQLSVSTYGVTVHEKRFSSTGSLLSEYDFTYPWIVTTGDSWVDCPSGYILNTGDNKCYTTAVNEQQVADAKLQIERTLNKFRKNPNDPDPVPPNVSISDSEVKVQTHERTTSAKINADGTATIKDITVSPDKQTTNVDTVKISAPTPGQPPQVIWKNHGTFPGVQLGGDIPSGNYGPIEPTVDGTVGGAAVPAATNLNLPENLARTDKQCGYDAAHPCKVELNEGEAPAPFEAPQIDQLDGQFDQLQTFINQRENGVGQGIQNPLTSKFSGRQCTDPGFDASDVRPNAKATVPICAHMAEIEPWTTLAAYIASAVLIYGIWFRRLGGPA